MIYEIKRNKAGFTLLEIVVVVSIFSVIMLLTAGIFQMAIDGQRSAIAAQDTQESIRYALEVMAKEIRMAQKLELGDCVGIPGGIIYYSAGSDNLAFKNSIGDCVQYELEDDVNSIPHIKITRGAVTGYITPDAIRVNNLEFLISDAAGTQPKVTLKIDIEANTAKAVHQNDLKIQTTISSRYYE